MKWTCENKKMNKHAIDAIQKELDFQFPEDYLAVIREHDGGYPFPNRITISNEEEILNNLVSFDSDDISFILDIYNSAENLNRSLIPIAEDPFGNLFCFCKSDENVKIIFWDHENPHKLTNVCDTFRELLSMLHE